MPRIDFSPTDTFLPEAFPIKPSDKPGPSIKSIRSSRYTASDLAADPLALRTLMRRLELLFFMAALLSPGLNLAGRAQDLLKIDASKQPAPPARGRGPFPGSTSPGHSASLPIRLALQISNGPLQPDGTVLTDFVITNMGAKTIAVPSSVDGNGPSSDILTLWLTSDKVNDAYAKDASTGRAFKIEIVPTSAELYGRSNDPRSFLLVAPNQSVKVHASSRVQLQPGTHTATAHAELLHTVRNASSSPDEIGRKGD